MRTHTCMYVRIHACMHAYTHTHAHTHSLTHPLLSSLSTTHSPTVISQPVKMSGSIRIALQACCSMAVNCSWFWGPWTGWVPHKLTVQTDCGHEHVRGTLGKCKTEGHFPHNITADYDLSFYVAAAERLPSLSICIYI